MSTEEIHKFGKDSMDMALSSLGAWTEGAQAIAVEVLDYSKKSAEGSAAAWKKVMNAKGLEQAIEVQTEYLKSSYEEFIARATKLGEIYVGLAKVAYRPLEGALGKATTPK